MSEINIELESVEAYVALRSMAEIMTFAERYASHDSKFNEHYASVDVLRDKIKKALKEQADIEDLRAGKEIINQTPIQ